MTRKNLEMMVGLFVMLGIAALVPFEGFFKGNALSGTKFIGASLALIVMLQLAIHQIPSERLRSNIWRYLIWFMVLYLLSMINTDNRIGINTPTRHTAGSFGRVGIEERHSLLGGNCSINSLPHSGTTVTSAVPLAYRVAPADDMRLSA